MRRGGAVWILAILVGWVAGMILGAYWPSWGLALAFPAATAVLVAGVRHAPDDERVAIALRLAMGAAIGFVPMTAGLTVLHFEEIRALAEDARHAAAEAASVGAIGSLWPRWVVMLLGVPIGAWALWKRPLWMRGRRAMN